MAGAVNSISSCRRFKVCTLLYPRHGVPGYGAGPQLWNLFFEDAAKAIDEYTFEEIVYADDLNAYKEFTSTTTNETAMEAVGNVQHELHR